MPVRTLARRLMSRLWFGLPRRAWQGGVLVAAVAGVSPLAAEITAAEFSNPTSRYPHGVLGDEIEYGSLLIHWSNTAQNQLSQDAVERHGTVVVRLPQSRVFEDLAPRLIDLDGDGQREIMVVESDASLGAQLAIYDQRGAKIAATPPIGTRFRWLAPIAAADLDNDGQVELAYVDRPHLAKTLRIWRFEAGALTQVAAMSGLTNHRIGDDFITSGLRNCAEAPELVLVDASWQRLVAVRLAKGEIHRRDIGPFTGQSSLQSALDCL
ncbi:VCBS repeat-containing protein [Pseudophaeobacter sp.]|uniref:FG-GAP repeat domain-containing protein n=1 Tax=Pseudophaeobacter sp. TaxID=1971739 RepID=UPI003296E7B4